MINKESPLWLPVCSVRASYKSRVRWLQQRNQLIFCVQLGVLKPVIPELFSDSSDADDISQRRNAELLHRRWITVPPRRGGGCGRGGLHWEAVQSLTLCWKLNMRIKLICMRHATHRSVYYDDRCGCGSLGAAGIGILIHSLTTERRSIRVVSEFKSRPLSVK